MPPLGSAAIASAFARATSSIVPTSSRCSGPMVVTSARSGRAIAQSSAICPRPRIPISVTSTSVSGSSRQTVSGRPISLFWLVGRIDRRDGCVAERTENVLRRRLSGRADDRDDACVALRADERRQRRERRVLVVGNERGRTAAPCLADVLDAGVERDEQIAGPTVRESAWMPTIAPASSPRSSRRAASAAISSHATGITVAPAGRVHRSAAPGRSRDRRTGGRRPRSPVPARVPCPR